MAFVRKVRTASGATAVQIAERVAGRDRVLEHLGSAHTDAELAALVATARSWLHPGQGELDLSGGRVAGGHAVIISKSHAVLWQVLTCAYARLGFDALDDEAFAQLVLARIVEPTSKVDSLRVLDELGIAHASLRTMFRSLARAQERDYRAVIADACFAHAGVAGDISLCLYDVTTLYFGLLRCFRTADLMVFSTLPGLAVGNCSGLRWVCGSRVLSVGGGCCRTPRCRR